MGASPAEPNLQHVRPSRDAIVVADPRDAKVRPPAHNLQDLPHAHGRDDGGGGDPRREDHRVPDRLPGDAREGPVQLLQVRGVHAALEARPLREHSLHLAAETVRGPVHIGYAEEPRMGVQMQSGTYAVEASYEDAEARQVGPLNGVRGSL